MILIWSFRFAAIIGIVAAILQRNWGTVLWALAALLQHERAESIGKQLNI